MEDIIIGVDLAKRIFQLLGATGSGEPIFRKRLTRDQFRDFMSRQPPSSVVFEACGNSSYWAREMHMLGHEVRLIAPQYVKPFVNVRRTTQLMRKRSLLQHGNLNCVLFRPRAKNSKRAPQSSEPVSVWCVNGQS